MKTRVFLSLAFALLGIRGNAQSLEFTPPDTLTFDYRTGGLTDTFDLSFSFPYTTMPSTGFSNRFQTPTVYFFEKSSSLFAVNTPTLISKKTFSALPHVGFSYSFGIKGTQFLHADYQQNLRNNTLINASIDRQSSNGFGQNSAYAYNNVKFGLFRNHKKINITLLGAYSSDVRGLNNGINDSLIEDLDNPQLGIEFVTANNTNASATYKGFNSSVNIKYNLAKDSSSTKIGPLLHSKYKLLNRIYTDDIDLLRDQYQDASISNGLGFFFERNHFSISTKVLHKYWRLQNSGSNIDTSEFSINGAFLWKRRKFALEADYYQNIIGAKSELDFKSRLRIGSKMKGAFAFTNFSDLLPTPLQRSYTGEYITYNTPLNKQQRLNIGVGGNYSFNKISINAKTGLLTTQNNFIWTGTDWTINQNSHLNLFYLDAKAHFDLGLIQWHPQAIVQTGSEYLPSVILSGRILIKKKVFEAKKLELQFSIDPQFNSTYNLMSYDVNIDNFYFNSANRVGGIPYSMHSTFSMGIQEFRFFIRGENIQAFWVKGSTEVLQNYYLSPFVLRLGLSWDFFN